MHKLTSDTLFSCIFQHRQVCISFQRTNTSIVVVIALHQKFNCRFLPDQEFGLVDFQPLLVKKLVAGLTIGFELRIPGSASLLICLLQLKAIATLNSPEGKRRILFSSPLSLYPTGHTSHLSIEKCSRENIGDNKKY